MLKISANVIWYRDMDHTDSNSIINRLGGTGAVAKLCDVTPQAVSQWREAGIPKPWMKYLQLAKPEEFAELGLVAAEPASGSA